MGTRKVSKLWFMALLLVVFMAGCGREQGTVSPTLTSISPNRGTQGQTVAVTLTGTSFTTGATLNMSGALITVTNTTVTSSTQITATFAIATNAVLGAVNISVTSSGQTTNAVTYTIGPPFTVTSTVPANGADGVPINQVLSATFSQAVNCATIITTGAAPTFTLKGPAGAVAVTLTSCSASTATFTPANPLTSNASYSATLTTGVQDSLGDPLLSNYVWSFATAPLPIVISTVPTNGATGVPVNQVLTATFSEAMNCATIASPATTFTLAGPGVTPVTGAVNCLGTSATFTLTSGTLLAANTLYTATISTAAKNLGGGALASNYVWTFTTELPPIVTSTVPINGAVNVPFSQVLTATFSEGMNCSTILTSGVFTLSGVGGGLVACSGASVTFTPASPLLPLTNYIATITTGATSPTGAPLASPYSWSFTTGAAPPTVTAIAPLNNATGVGFNTTITAQFDEAMLGATVSGAFTLTAGGAASLITPCVASAGTVVGGTPSYNATNNIITFTPSPILKPSTCYTATITTAAENSAGIAMAANYVWVFATGAAPAVTPPTVISTVPVTATPPVTGVPLNQEITATFSEAMNATTINTTTFTLTYLVGGVPTTVLGVVGYIGSGPSAIFIPDSDLLPDTYYTATITNGVADLAGNFMVNNYVWNFTTAAATVSAAPLLDSTIPASGATGVCLNAAISATFSTAMNATATSVNTTTFAVTGPTGLVTGTYSQDITGTIITFTPASDLAPLTTYTVTINGITDLAGTPLGSPGLVPNPWSFETGSATSCLGPVPLGVATPFGGFGGGAGMTSQGSNTVVNGDIGTTGASSTMTGFHDTTEPYIPYSEGCIYSESGYTGTVNGEIFTAGPTLPTVASCPNEGTAATMAVATQAAADALTAYNALAAMPSDFGCPGSGNGAGLTLPPGVYTCASTFGLSLGNLTLDAQGDANAVWVFQIGSALTVGTASVASSVKLINGAQPQNVFWQAATGAVINYGGGGTMVGTIIALTGGITISSPGVATITTLNGRALSLGASVTMVNTVINVPGQ